jgi:hypothetical protein
MKLTNPETIQESEKEFIDTINAELDWDAIEKMLLEKHNFTLQDEIDYKDGDLVVHNDAIAYKFDFEIKVPLSVIFNREGECVEISTIRDDFDDEEPDESEDEELNEDGLSENESDEKIGDDLSRDDDTVLLEPEKNNKVAQMASNLADMISEINQGDE